MSAEPVTAANSAAPDVSLIVPVFDEVDSLRPLLAEIRAALANWGHTYEIVFVDDGSRDGSTAILEEFAQQQDVTVVSFRRNYGQTAALSAGIEYARGAILAPLDADLQNDPADIPRLVAKLDEGYDVVSGWRRRRQDAAVSRNLPSRIANWLISWTTGVRLHDYGCTLKAYRRDALSDVKLYGEMHRFIPVYAAMQGGKVVEMEVNHRARKFGSSKYGLERIGKVILDLLLVKFLAQYASKPIYVFGGFGLLSMLLALPCIALSIYFKVLPAEKPFQKDFVETPLPVMAAVFLVTGLLSILMGLLAEILMRTYHESQGKRPYDVKSVRGGSRPCAGS